MALMVATDKLIVTARELHVDCYNYKEHKTISIPVTSKTNEKDSISDIAVSNDGTHLAVVTAASKQLILYDLPQMEQVKSYTIPRSASRIRFTVDDKQVLVADKSGDILIYELKVESLGEKILGHLSLLLDVLQTNDSRFIISCDRDEKIRVSCYPNTYNIQTYCLGHKEFVNHIELVPHNDNHLSSSSGDGTVKIWNYKEGTLKHTIDTSVDVNDDQLKQNFINLMDEAEIEVSALPVVHYAASSINKSSSIIALTVHSYNYVMIYSVSNENGQFTHKLEHKVPLERFPSAVKLYKDTLFVYDDVQLNVYTYKLVENNGNVSVASDSTIRVFESNAINTENKATQLEAIKVLYKRKFDNVQEYQERKKARLEKSK